VAARKFDDLGEGRSRVVIEGTGLKPFIFVGVPQAMSMVLE